MHAQTTGSAKTLYESELQELASMDLDAPVLSIYALTDPRDPANGNRVAAWQVRARNGLGAIDLAGADRGERLAARELRY